MTLKDKLQKAAEGDYNMARHSIQQYVPTMDRRELTPEELKLIEERESKIIPKIFQSHGDPIAVKMSSPTAGGWMGGGLGGLFGAGLGGMVGLQVGALLALSKAKANGSARKRMAGLGAGIGALAGLGIGGGIGGLIGYHGVKARNETLKDYMRRLPRNATIRDLKSDAAYQKDLDRAYARQNAGLWVSALAGR